MGNDINDYDNFRELYDNIMKGDVVAVNKFYNKIKQDPPRNLTVHKDTVLHMAIVMRHENVAKEILKNHIRDQSTLLQPNVFGDTILHEAAATPMTGFVTELLSREPRLLSIPNINGEMPLFKAAYFGQTDMFKLLAEEVDKIGITDNVKLHLTRESDKATILHITILAEFFDLAHFIANKYPDLQQAKNNDGMTGLQLLSNNPSAFKSGSSLGLTKTLLYYCTNLALAQSSFTFTETDKESIDLPSIAVLVSPGAPSRERDGIVSHEVDQIVFSDEQERPLLPPTCNTCVHFCYVVSSELRNIKKLAWNFFGQGWPMMDNIWKEKKKHESALSLARLLIRNDFSWEESSPKPDKLNISIIRHERHLSIEPKTSKTEPITSEQKQKNNDSEENPLLIATSNRIIEIVPETSKTEPITSEQKQKKNNSEETPLLIATSNGIIEIVDEILSMYPQAVEHVSKIGTNILHVAIRHRQTKIFNRVKKMLIPLSRLVRSIDDKDYTILHYVGVMDNYCGGTKPGPALQLQEELFWFDDIMPPRYAMHRSKVENETAEEFFKRKHKPLLKEAQDWLKRTSESSSTVAVLIATAAFTAAYTVPGGPNDDGLPILLDRTFFIVFTIMDVLSLASSLTSVVMFLSILTSPFQIEDFRYNLPRKLVLGFTLLFFSVAVTMLAFAATVLLIVDLKSRSSMLLVYMVAFLPVSIFALLQFPLFVALTALNYSFEVIGKVIRRAFRFPTAYSVHRYRKIN
ncbi:hypothetical protein ACFE04_000513 [Oxalis oulophora]